MKSAYEETSLSARCRPPCGGRGLKCDCPEAVENRKPVAPRVGGVD